MSLEVTNRKAKYDYAVLETYEAGIVLTGTEIKSVRAGSVVISDSYAIIKENEIYLLNCSISHYKQGNIFNHDVDRTRKLLLHKKEIKKIQESIKVSGITLIPLKLYIKNGYAKLLIGICKGKKNYDKKNVIKERDIDRYNKKEFKYR